MLPLLVIFVWGFLNVNSVKNFYDNYAQLIPFFYSSPSEYLVKNIDKLPIKNISEKISDKNVDEKIDDVPEVVEEIITPINQEEEKTGQLDKKKIDMGASKSVEVDETPENPIENQKSPKVEPNLVQPKQSSEVVKTEENKAKYFIIGGAFEILSNAENFVEDLKNQGFDAEIVGLNKYGLYRVSYSGFSERSEASKQLKLIKKEKNPSAWILAK